MKKKFLALVMTLSMVLSLVPMTALAAGDQSAAEPTQETQVKQQQQAEEAGTQGEVKGQQTQNAGGNAGEVNTSSNVSAENVHVTMNNIFMGTNNTSCTIEYKVEPTEYADKITFEYDTNSISYLEENNSKDAFKIGAQYKSDESGKPAPANKAGDTTEIKAMYEGKEVGICKIIFAPADKALISYSTVSEEYEIKYGSYLNVPLGTPIEVCAVWDSEGIFNNLKPTVSLEWKSENESVADITAGEKVDDTTSKAKVTVYQQSNGAYTKIYAQPTVVIGREEYVFPNPSGLSVQSVSQSVKCAYKTFENPTSVWEGSELTFTFDAVPEDAKVSWTCSKEGLMDFSKQHERTATVETLKGIVNEPSENVCVTATATVGGHEYKGMYRLSVFVRPITMDRVVSTLEELQEAITDSSIKNIAIKQTILLPKGTNLDLSGKNIYRAKENTQAVFAISAPNVTMSGGTIDGQYVRAEAPLISITQNGSLTLSNVTLQKAINEKLKGGAISVTEGVLSCDSVKFNNNTVEGNIKDENYRNGGAAVYGCKSTINIKDSYFEKNEALDCNGGAVYFDLGSKGTFQGNTVTDCQAISGDRITTQGTMSSGFGGAISCCGSGKVELIENTVTNCYAARGGGIYVLADTISDITIDKNIIQGCKASYRGGGLALINTQAAQDKAGADRENNHIKLKSGEISGCTAWWGGGIDYSAHGMNPLYLTNVIITGNSAEATTHQDMGHGGGIWACPVSQTKTYSTLGGAIYGNSAAKGDDVMYEGIDTQDRYALQNSKSAAMAESVMNVSPRALGGGKITWFADYNGEYSAGTSKPAASETYTNVKNSFGLHGELSKDNATRAGQAENKLVIANNTATNSFHAYGGGIATNSQIVIGLEGHDKSVTVTKSWSQETHPDSATVTLMQKDADNKSVALETVTLNEENGWTYTFENLPGAYTASNGDVKDYTYSVSETAISGWTASIKEVDDKDNDAKTIAFEITNSPKRGGGSSGGGPITIPDDVPTGLDLKNHYGYIIGYPVDYYTGKPTTDQTKKPVRPEGKITRAEVATIYFRMLTDENRAANWNQVSGFSDVKSSAWYNNAISTLTKAGILKGYEDGTFQPDGYITRAEFATIAIRFFSGVYEGEDLFPDIKGHWAEDYINNAANKGLVKGYEDGTFGPDRYITRAEAVTLVNRTLNRHPHNDGLHKDMLVWPDNMDTSKWYYADMQEATNSHEPDKDKTTADKEYWGKMLPIRDWEALEKEWSNANSAPGEGEVV